MNNNVCNNGNFINSSKPLSKCQQNQSQTFYEVFAVRPLSCPAGVGRVILYTWQLCQGVGIREAEVFRKGSWNLESLNLSNIFKNQCHLHTTIAILCMNLCKYYLSGLCDACKMQSAFCFITWDFVDWD